MFSCFLTKGKKAFTYPFKLIQEDDCKYYWEIEEVDFDSISIWKKLCLSYCRDELDSNQYKIIKGILGE